MSNTSESLEQNAEAAHLSLRETTKRMKSNLESELQKELDGRLKIPTAEVDSLLSKLRGIAREMTLGGWAIKELGAKGDIDYHETGETITIPTELGERVYSLHIFTDQNLRQPKFRLEALTN